MGSKIKDIDHGWEEAKKQLNKVDGGAVRVGILQDAPAYEDGTTMAEVAFFNEFGTKTIPERSFLRTTYDENIKKYTMFVAENMFQIFAGKIKGKTAMRRLGTMAQSDIRKKIKAIKTPPLSNTTIELRRRRKTHGLYDVTAKDVGDAYKAGQSAFFKPAGANEANPLIDTGHLLRKIDFELKGFK